MVLNSWVSLHFPMKSIILRKVLHEEIKGLKL
jgi:hypothetical protein